MFKLILILSAFIFISCGENKSKKVNNFDILTDKQLLIKREMMINSENDSLLYGISGFTTSMDGNIVVCDDVDFDIKKFDIMGKLINVYGSRGRGPNEFTLPPCQIAYNEKRNLYAVIERTSHVIKLFNGRFDFVKQILNAAPVSDIVFDDESNLITVTPPAPQFFKTINIFDREGNLKSSFNPSNLTGEMLFDMCYLNYNSCKKKIILMYLFRNLIQVYDLNGKLNNEFSLPFLPLKAESEKFNNNSGLPTPVKGIPIKHIFWDISSDDQGHLYILSGNYAKNGNKKEIYVTSTEGKLLRVINLDFESKFIYVPPKQHGYFYATSNKETAVGKYRMIW
ncbi:MAG: hypothetical protein COT22_01110 [Ignavibacteria bacterium CG08_land_8_20_14_0_20_37_9]|nr:MAG: hypothetical protein COT22_01110 [Ignavibacteria bacterium CG08_land_8_20_14_0_20_37_9]PJC58778.1 MAG: hypothetical protein CO025_08270 [Ignavibacteria bacterium CG_4_9_14_0_2_um_filter_37_13]